MEHPNTCDACGMPTDTCVCRFCGATYAQGAWHMAEKKVVTLPRWKPSEVAYCDKCEIIVLKSAHMAEGGIFSDAGVFCPKCERKLADKEE